MREPEHTPRDKAFFERRDHASIKATQDRLNNIALKNRNRIRRAAPRKMLSKFVLLTILTPILIFLSFHEFDMIRAAWPATFIILGSLGMLTAIWLWTFRGLRGAYKDYLGRPMHRRQRRAQRKVLQNAIDQHFHVSLIVTLIGACIFGSWIAIEAVYSVDLWPLAVVVGIWVPVVFRRLYCLLHTPLKIDDFFSN